MECSTGRIEIDFNLVLVQLVSYYRMHSTVSKSVQYICTIWSANTSSKLVVHIHHTVTCDSNEIRVWSSLVRQALRRMSDDCASLKSIDIQVQVQYPG